MSLVPIIEIFDPQDRSIQIPPAMVQEAQRLYSSPLRFYHTFDHAVDVCKSVNQVAIDIGWQHPREVMVAALFHDAIYIAGRKDNEQKSADQACEISLQYWPGINIEYIRQLITLTAKHGQLSPADVLDEAALFLDCDMAILGATADAFAHYHDGVAQEYAQIMPKFLYRIARRRFLKRLLSKEYIYLSAYFHQRLDVAARRNIKHCLYEKD